MDEVVGTEAVVLDWLSNAEIENDVASLAKQLILNYHAQIDAMRRADRAYQALVGALYCRIDVLEKRFKDGNQ